MWSARCPIRIDLAGGTLDLWPIYLLLPETRTLNLAIDLFAECRVTPHDNAANPGLVLESTDQKTSVELGWDQIHSAEVPSTLVLPLKLIQLARKKFPTRFAPSLRLEVTTLGRSPAGAGLGGSSALTVAIVAAVHAWIHEITHLPEPRSPEGLALRTHWIETARDIESQILYGPAGLQDYYGAMFGGLQSLRWGIADHESVELGTPAALEGLKKRVGVFYSGKSRNSGINNWALYKSFVDRDPKTQTLFREIHDATHELETALGQLNWPNVVSAIQREWNARRQLASGISTPEIDAGFAALDQVAQQHSTRVATKICGAGGGGCFFYLSESDQPETIAALTQCLEQHGFQSLNPQWVTHGLEITSSPGN